MTALTVNGSAHAATTLAAAGQLYAATGGTSGNTSTKVGTSTQFKQIFALGTSTNQSGVSSIPAPTDANWHGWMWDVTTLEGQEIAAGTWTPTIHLLASTGTTVTPTVQWYKRSSAGGYTSIGSVAGSSIALTTSAQLLVFTAPSLSLMDFATGDKLMMWLWVNQTAGGATNSTISVVEATSASTSGVAAGEAKTVTPGYAPSPVALSATIAGIGTEKATLYADGAAQLTVYPVHIAASGLTTANRLVDSGSGTTGTGVDTALGLATGWGEVVALGTVQTWGTGITALTDPPTGKGMLYDLTTLEGMTLITGNYTPTRRTRINGGNGNLTVDMYIRHYKYNPASGGTYTLIGTTSLLAQTFTSTSVTRTFSPISLSSMDFATGDKLYIDEPMNVTANANTLTAGTIRSDVATSTTVGELNSQLVLSGYILTPQTVALSCECDGIGTLAGTVQLSTALTTECDGIGQLSGTLDNGLYATTVLLDGPVRYYRLGEASGTTAHDTGTAGQNGAIQTGVTLAEPGALVADTDTSMLFDGTAGYISAPTTGLGSVATLSVEAWVNLTSFAQDTGAIDQRVLINTIDASNAFQLSTQGSNTAFVWAVNDAGTQYIISSAGYSTGAWYHVVGTYNTTGHVITLYVNGVSVSNTGGASGYGLGTAPYFNLGKRSDGGHYNGYLDEAAIYTTVLSAAQVMTHYLAGVLTVTFAGAGTLAGTLSTSSGGVSLSVTMAGVGTLTETLSLATALTSTIAGVGILTPTLSVNLTLSSVTIPGVGTLTATMSETTALATTIPGIGTLNGTFSLATALSTTLAGVGTLTGTLSTTGGVSLAVTMAGVGTLAGTMTESTALTTTMQGVGTLSPTLSAHLALAPVTMVGVGTLTGTAVLSTALGSIMSGAGTLSGVFTIRVALSLTFAGIGTLAGAVTIPSLSFLSTICVTRDMQAIAKTRDLVAIAITRDKQAGALTRDEQATATTRDEQATATTRS